MRNQFKSVLNVPITNLLLDLNNPRLGQLDSQKDCLEMLLRNMGPKIAAIAEHIALFGLSPDHIVISKSEQQPAAWTVRDGNRRIAALKLLSNPLIAPEKYQLIFRKLSEKAEQNGNIIDSVDCLTAPESILLGYIELLHRGQQGGAGRVNWDSKELDNFLESKGEKRRNEEATIVLNYLLKKGIAAADKVKITNMQRFFQDKYIQDSLGIKFDNNTLYFNKNEQLAFQIMKEFAIDFSERKGTVGLIYDEYDRKTYLDSLFASINSSNNESKLSPTSALANNKGAEAKDAPKAAHTTPINPPRARLRLIPPRNGISLPSSAIKARTIQNELSRKISVRDAPLAAAILLRIFLELTVDHYILTTNLNVTKDNLKDKIELIGLKLYDQKTISKKQIQILRKMRQSEQLISIHTLNSCVHDLTYIPKGDDLCVFWDNISFFVRMCWQA